MNKSIKYFFLLVLCFGITAGFNTNVRAQYGNDQILVNAGKKTLRQSDVDKLIEFYEWVFETKFTGTQRRSFQGFTADEFRAAPAPTRKTIDDILTMLPQILAADENVQQKTREEFLGVFLPELRKNNDENSRMLLDIYQASRGGNSRDEQANVAGNNSGNTNDSDQSEDDNNSSNANVGNISSLAGKWVWGRSGSSTYTPGGAFMGSNGSRHTYQFSPNGTVEYTGIMNIMTGGCKMQVFRSMRGKASLRGDTLTINWSPASFSRDDSCSPSKNYKKTMPAETETYKITFKESYGQKQLCMTRSEETCFSPGN